MLQYNTASLSEVVGMLSSRSKFQ